MTITPELKAAVERSGNEPVRIEDPETKTAYLVIREEVYYKMREMLAYDHSDLSLFEYEEYHPLDETP